MHSWSLSAEEFLSSLCNGLLSTRAEGIEICPLKIWYRMDSFRQCLRSSRVGTLQMFIRVSSIAKKNSTAQYSYIGPAARCSWYIAQGYLYNISTALRQPRERVN